jgi:hypothetical protein
VRDARDTLGHYPPVCYPGQGWKVESTAAQDWTGANREVHGMEYQFSRADAAGTSYLVVDDFMMLPDGQTCRDMDSVERSAQDRKRKFFGAAQVQVVFGGEFSSARRREIVESFLRYAEPAFKVISTGVPHEQ